MKCPCLRETPVQTCAGATIRKLIQTSAVAAGEKCTSAAYRTCPVFLDANYDGVGSGTCPLLQERVVQYCAAASAPQYVPWSEHSFSRCGASGHRYCELYLQISGASRGIENADGIDLSPRLAYTRNHFWFDAGEDGWWHAGIDGLLARALGHVDAITFITTEGVSCPSVVVTLGSSDYTLTFPHPVRVSGCNSWLRADPARLIDSPYTFGWLFEGIGEAPAELIRGEAARTWMANESDRASRVLHSSLACPADGGVFATGVLREIDRESSYRFVQAMFSPVGGKQ